LHTKIQDIKNKAEQSEQMVQKITKDIKSLDFGKKHLSSTINSVEKLYSLVSIVDQLKELVDTRKYKQAATKLQSTNQLTAHFAQYKDILKVKKLFMALESIKDDLKYQIFKDFKSLDALEEHSDIEVLLGDACLVIDALGDKVRNELIAQFVKQQISLYKMIYTGKGKKSNLDDVKKRYGWIRKLIDEKYQSIYSRVFPDYWCIRQELVIEFCLATREDIVNILNDQRETIDPTVLYRAIVNTIRFERMMQERYHVFSEVEKNQDILRQQEKLSKEAEELDNTEGNNSSADAIKKRFRMLLKQRELERRSQLQQNTTDFIKQQQQQEKQKNLPVTKNYNFLGFISSCFDDHLDTYIQYEDRSMKDVLDKYVSKETWSQSDGTHSAQDLFMYISDSIQNCLSLSKGKLLVRLLDEVWRKALRKYADFLSLHLPKITTQVASAATNKDNFLKLDFGGLKGLVGTDDANSGAASAKTLKTRFTEDEEKKVCFIIHLAVYVQDNIEIMQDQLRTKLEEPYSSQIELSEEMSKFYVILKESVGQLSLNLTSFIDAEYASIPFLPLATMTEVIDQSNYVTNIVTHLSDALTYLADLISPSNFKLLCDTLVMSMIPSFLSHVYKCKKINATGCQQLLLDLISLVNFLKSLINIGDPNRFDEDEVITFAKKVQHKAAKPEAILKVMLSPTDALIDTYRGLIQDGSPQELSTIMDLKGLTKNERILITDEYSKSEDIKQTGISALFKGKATDGLSTTMEFMGAMRGAFGMQSNNNNTGS
jgi:hypothetical protein